MVDQQKLTRFTENFIIIWMDSKYHRQKKWHDELQTSITSFHLNTNSIKIFKTSETCIDFINNNIKQEKIYLIVSGSSGRQLINQIEDNNKIDSIYVFSPNKSKHKKWMKIQQQHYKITGIYPHLTDICEKIKQDIKYGEHELTTIQTVSSETLRSYNHLDASFMYSQLFKEILLSIEHNDVRFDRAKNDFIEFCRVYYASNNNALSIIEEFKENYNKPSPIWWYTRECFIYSMLNRALCSQDVEILIKMSFFISDLHRQLEYLHKTINNRQVLTVYRGQGMLYAAFDRMKQNQGGLISFNNFLSTSTSRDVSLCFAEKALEKPEKVAILFEMNIDPSISSVPYASLDKLSYFQDNEHEVLFSMHTVFRIGHIKPLTNDEQPRLWHVQLTSTNSDDEELRQLTEHMRMELSSLLASDLQINMDPIWRLSKLLTNMGEYDKAIVIYNIMLDNAQRDNDIRLLQAIHYQIAELVMFCKSDWKQAKEHLKQMYTVTLPGSEAVVDEAKNDLKNVFSNIKDVLINDDISEDDFHATMSELLEKLIIICRDYSRTPLTVLHHQLFVDRYNYIGWVRQKQRNLSEAWDYHHRALEILREYLPSTHPRWAVTYNHIGLLNAMMDNHFDALDCLQKALTIQNKALQPNHPHIAKTHFHLSTIYERLNKTDDALHHAKEAIDIGHQGFLTADDPDMKMYQEQYDKLQLVTQSTDELVL